MSLFWLLVVVVWRAGVRRSPTIKGEQMKRLKLFGASCSLALRWEITIRANLVFQLVLIALNIAMAPKSCSYRSLYGSKLMSTTAGILQNTLR